MYSERRPEKREKHEWDSRAATNLIDCGLLKILTRLDCRISCDAFLNEASYTTPKIQFVLVNSRAEMISFVVALRSGISRWRMRAKKFILLAALEMKPTKS